MINNGRIRNIILIIQLVIYVLIAVEQVLVVKLVKVS